MFYSTSHTHRGEIHVPTTTPPLSNHRTRRLHYKAINKQSYQLNWGLEEAAAGRQADPLALSQAQLPPSDYVCFHSIHRL